jgi:class 3 adenylate cyclase
MDAGRDNAVLFAELIGAAELYARDGDAVAHQVIAMYAERLGRVAASCHAKVLKMTGSRIMVLAASADAAAGAAVAMQVAAVGFLPTGPRDLGLGVGFHYGPVIQDNDDVFGDTVNLAARLVEQAARGQILFAAETAAVLSEVYRSAMRRLYSIPLKGRSEEVALCELVWRANEGVTFYPVRTGAQPPSAKLRLKYRGVRLVLQHGPEALTIGREGDCGLVLMDTQASRHHCTILRRNDHFVLVDRSTNGTFVTVEGEDEVALQHDELTLRKRGWISFGTPRGSGGEGLEFACD